MQPMLNQTTQAIQQKFNFILNCHNINFIHKELINVYKQRGGSFDDFDDMLKVSINLLQSPPCIRPTYRESLRNNLAIRKLLDTPFETGNPKINTVEDAYVYLLRALSDRCLTIHDTVIDERDIQRIQKLMVTAVTKDVTSMDNRFDYYTDPPKSRLIQECNKVHQTISNNDSKDKPLAILFELMPNVKDEWLLLHGDIYNNMVRDYCQPKTHAIILATHELDELMVGNIVDEYRAQDDTNETPNNTKKHLEHISRKMKESDDYEEIITWNIVNRLYKTLIYDPN